MRPLPSTSFALLLACGSPPLPDYEARDLDIDVQRACARPEARDGSARPAIVVEQGVRFALSGRFRTAEGDSAQAEGRTLGVFVDAAREPLDEVELRADGAFSFDLQAPTVEGTRTFGAVQPWALAVGLVDADERPPIQSDVVSPLRSGTAIYCTFITDAVGNSVTQADPGESLLVVARASLETIDDPTLLVRVGNTAIGTGAIGPFDPSTGWSQTTLQAEVPWAEIDGDSAEIVATAEITEDDPNGPTTTRATSPPVRVDRP